ncbi:ABC transporter ATP-binding protein [Thermophagus xiamenensis]|uniref:ABC-2 type transport system ATP-binding protein n=1 Tax=Thermophagus xiamenensis TaxID=385682 RepID=A0A1I1V6U2_9BACT|nr:ABC transporter ATP-binding protein [Thermophagus xiamenensis]SFD78761.1 ABC-2 type transport system ATP-binding protein [Thermophagus xiamenensis]
MEKIIEVEGLTKKYGDYTAVDNLNLSIAKGEVFGLLGPNGAGKSTTILMLLGLTEPNSGRAKVCGIDPVQSPISVKKKVGYLPEDVGFYEDLTGFDNLVYTARLNNIPQDQAEQKANELLEKIGLGKEKFKKTGKYSRGMRQRLGLADVLIKNPEVIILDEPTLGIDPTGVKAFLQLIVKLSREDGITVLFSSHLLHQVQQVCDRVGIFVEGKLLAQGNIKDLSAQLFSTNSFVVQGGIKPLKLNGSENTVPVEKLSDRLKAIPGVAQVSFDDQKFEIQAEQDVTHMVSQAIVQAGYGLTFLSKKEFGLDDIYSRYFQ